MKTRPSRKRPRASRRRPPRARGARPRASRAPVVRPETGETRETCGVSRRRPRPRSRASLGLRLVVPEAASPAAEAPRATRARAAASTAPTPAAPTRGARLDVSRTRRAPGHATRPSRRAGECERLLERRAGTTRKTPKLCIRKEATKCRRPSVRRERRARRGFSTFRRFNLFDF